MNGKYYIFQCLFHPRNMRQAIHKNIAFHRLCSIRYHNKSNYVVKVGITPTKPLTINSVKHPVRLNTCVNISKFSPIYRRPLSSLLIYTQLYF